MYPFMKTQDKHFPLTHFLCLACTMALECDPDRWLTSILPIDWILNPRTSANPPEVYRKTFTHFTQLLYKVIYWEQPFISATLVHGHGDQLGRNTHGRYCCFQWTACFLELDTLWSYLRKISPSHNLGWIKAPAFILHFMIYNPCHWSEGVCIHSCRVRLSKELGISLTLLSLQYGWASTECFWKLYLWPFDVAVDM